MNESRQQPDKMASSDQVTEKQYIDIDSVRNMLVRNNCMNFTNL